MKKSKKIINKKKNKKTLNKRKIYKRKRRKTKRCKTKRQKTKKYRGGVKPNHETRRRERGGEFGGTKYYGEGYYENNNYIKHGWGRYERTIHKIKWLITGTWRRNKLERQTLYIEKFDTSLPVDVLFYTYEGQGSYDDEDDNLLVTDGLVKDGYGQLEVLDEQGGQLTIDGYWEENTIRDREMDYTYITEHKPLKKHIYSGRGSYGGGKISRSGGFGKLSLFEGIADQIPVYEYEGMWEKNRMINEMIITMMDKAGNKTRRYEIVFREDTNIISEISLFEGDDVNNPQRNYYKIGELTSETNNVRDFNLEEPLTFLERIQFGPRGKNVKRDEFTNMRLTSHSVPANTGEENMAPWGRRA